MILLPHVTVLAHDMRSVPELATDVTRRRSSRIGEEGGFAHIGRQSKPRHRKGGIYSHQAHGPSMWPKCANLVLSVIPEARRGSYRTSNGG